MGTRQQGTRAWVICWDWFGDQNAVEERIAAILPWRWGAERIRSIVEVIHDERLLTRSEMLRFVANRKDCPIAARPDTVTMDGSTGPVTIPREGGFFCGHNPWLEARQATVIENPRYRGDHMGERAKVAAHEIDQYYRARLQPNQNPQSSVVNSLTGTAPSLSTLARHPGPSPARHLDLLHFMLRYDLIVTTKVDRGRAPPVDTRTRGGPSRGPNFTERPRLRLQVQRGSRARGNLPSGAASPSDSTEPSAEST